MDGNFHIENGQSIALRNYQHIYITSDEEIKEGDWQIDSKNRVNKFSSISMNLLGETYQKIILTTDQDLIKAGVQAIDDKFLEWFVENPNCKLIEVKPLLSNNGRVLFGYKIIIPQEEQEQFVECKCTNSLQAENCIRNCGHGKEPKQETLEEAAERYANDWEEIHPTLDFENMTPIAVSKIDFIEGAKSNATKDYWFEIFKKQNL